MLRANLAAIQSLRIQLFPKSPSRYISLNQLIFTRNQYAARVARIRKDLPAELAKTFGETACRDRELRGGRWPLRAVLGEREYAEEIRNRANLPAVLDPEFSTSACIAVI